MDEKVQRSISDQSNPDAALENLPDAYADWRGRALGRITDTLEERLLLERISPAPSIPWIL